MANPELSPVCRYVSERTGSSLSRHQVRRLLDAIGALRGGLDELTYLEHLKSVRGAGEMDELMSVISVHKTDLFRDEVQLEAVRETLLPELVAGHRPLKVWSAGCATGEEVATLLILLEDARADPLSTVLGTDISATALKAAQPLGFSAETLRRVPPPIRDRYFSQARGGWELSRRLAARARWQRHNLMDQPYPLPVGGGGFDLIVCRNVLIYFTEDAWALVVHSLVERLRPGGVLVLGGADPILAKNPQLEVIRLTNAFFYRRRIGPEVVPIVTPRATPPGAPGRTRSSEPERPRDAAAAVAEDPREEGLKLFQRILERAAAGDKTEETEMGLRKALYLTPDLAPARYLLGVLLEQREANADASSEYRRALALLNEGQARATPFYLNAERLKVACQQALKRLGYR